MNLLWDAARKSIDICEWFGNNEGVVGWRKAKSWKREIKKIFRISSKASSAGGKNKESRLCDVVTEYLQLCKKLDLKVNNMLAQSTCFTGSKAIAKHIELVYFHKMLTKHINLVERRIIQEEIIDSNDKLYSIFETHSEWLSKGKKFNPVEIGHNVLIATDQFNFILYHQVLEKQMDVQITKEVTSRLVKKFPTLIQALSFDKGFYSKANKAFVEKMIPQTIMPKKGKRNKAETQHEHQARFVKLRNAHSAIESNINQLMHNGLGRCPDRGIESFKRYTALSVLAYNLHKLGEYITKGQIIKKAG